MHKPIQLKHISFSLQHKMCFEDFNAQIFYGNRIAIMGQNGSGKSSLLKILQGQIQPSDGQILIPFDANMSYVPQTIHSFQSMSGGQSLNHALTQALMIKPNILLLDEPTNHLDRSNRRSLLRMLSSYQGTLIVVSHDRELLRNTVEILWHIDEGKIHEFNGDYDDYQREISIKRASISQQLGMLNRQKKETHESLMREQTRAKNSKARGEKNIAQRKWATVTSVTKMSRGNETGGKKKRELRNKSDELSEQLSHLRLPLQIKPTFSLSAAPKSASTLVSISAGQISYGLALIIEDINLSVSAQARIAITGDNASGKTTFLKAILNDPRVIKTGFWQSPKTEEVGYLDQNYATLDPKCSVFDTIYAVTPHWTHAEIRKHLNDFLFRKNEEVSVLVSTLSGGEQARLSLAIIAAKTPKLLILDEPTNNLDLETTEHMIQVLKHYPGTLIAVSHDDHFLQAINVTTFYNIEEKRIKRL